MKTDFKTNIKAIIARAYVRVVAGNREPSWVISETVLPLISTAAFVYVYKALNAPEEFTGFVVLGGAMSAYWMTVLWSMAAQFYWEKEIGNLDLYMIAPISRMSILLGMASGGFVYASVRAGSVFLLGSLIFKIDFGVIDFGRLFLIFILCQFALFGLGMLFSSLFMIYGREAWHGVSLFQEPVYLLSGFYFPVKSLGFTLALTASLIPLTLGLDGMRQLAFKKGVEMGFLNINLEIGILAFLCVFFMVASHYALQFMENLGKKTGRLTLRWQ
ncbi:MAG: ABC transporter [candidate division Zixibacteria bacterium SM23_73_2]|nr:MAG: ABC transporter [candidate division Zixibacteria bacterium SM23_73_2]